MQTAFRCTALLSLAMLGVTGGCRKPLDDATLSASVQTRLAADSALSTESIQSSVQAGVATLNGSVSSDAARVLAGNDAAAVSGIRTVINNLTVASAANAQPLPPAPTVTIAPIRLPPASKPSASLSRRKIEPVAPPPPVPVERLPPVAASLAPPPPPPPPPAPAFHNVTIPAGTSISVRLTQTLDSASTQQGDTFSGSIASDILINGTVAIPQGAGITGKVDAVQEAAHFKGNSLLSIEATGLSRHGEHTPISTEPYSKQGAGRGKNTAVKTGVGAAAGAVLGGIFGGGSGAAIGAAAGGGAGAGINGVTRGQQVQIPSESIIPFRLTADLTLRVSTGAHPESPDAQRHPLNDSPTPPQ